METLSVIQEQSDDQLISGVKSLVQKERKITSQVLRYLKVIEGRKLYLKLGFPSLFAFCTEELKYSESASFRRIEAMRLLKDLPVLEGKIESGKISLSVVSQVSSFIRKENKKRKFNNNKPLEVREKLELIQQVEGASARECEKKLVQISPEMALPKEVIRSLDSEHTLLKLTANSGLMKKLDRARALLSHQCPEGKLEAILDKVLDTFLDNRDPVRREERRVQAKQRKMAKEKALGCEKDSPSKSTDLLPTLEVRLTPKPRRSIPKGLRDRVFVRGKGRCEYRDLKTGRVCGSDRLVQVDHRFPWALGGEHSDSNLRLLCYSHNQGAASEVF